jgi:cobalt-zinc-cadmium efflux system membrane fusion protein
MKSDAPDSAERSAGAGGWSTARQLILLALVVAGLLLVFIAGSMRRAAAGRGTAAAAPAPAGTFRPTTKQLRTLTIEAVDQRAFVSEERTEGRIAVNADRATPVYSPYSGRITRVIANLGDLVQKGGALAAIDASEFSQGLNDLRTTGAQLRLARLAEARKHALFDARGGSLADWQQAQADLAAAGTALAAARSRLQILGYSGSQIDRLASGQEFAPAANIVAPIRGIVIERQVGPGQYAQAGSGTALFTMADLSSVWLIANVREADAAHVHRGQQVEAHVLAWPDRTFSAHIVYVAPTIDDATHRLPVRAEIDNSDGALKPGMFANFEIQTSAPDRSPAVPAGAVVYEGDNAHVWVLQPDGVLAIRPIRAGRSSDGYVEVTEGLQPGERVVTRGSLFIDRAATG